MSNSQAYKVKDDELNCESVRDDLHSFLMNELPDKEVKSIAAHLAVERLQEINWFGVESDCVVGTGEEIELVSVGDRFGPTLSSACCLLNEHGGPRRRQC